MVYELYAVKGDKDQIYTSYYKSQYHIFSPVSEHTHSLQPFQHLLLSKLMIFCQYVKFPQDLVMLIHMD